MKFIILCIIKKKLIYYIACKWIIKYKPNRHNPFICMIMLTTNFKISLTCIVLPLNKKLEKFHILI